MDAKSQVRLIRHTSGTGNLLRLAARVTLKSFHEQFLLETKVFQYFVNRSSYFEARRIKLWQIR